MSVLDLLADLWNQNHHAVLELGGKVLTSLITAIICAVISKALQRLVKKAASGRFNVDDTVSSILCYIIKYGILIICAVMILNIFGFNTASLIALLGAAGIAIGLALKDTLGNIAAGIILLFLGSYRKGEYIEFGSFNGTVKEINLFTTVLETFDGLYVSAPNSSIWGNPIKNFTRNGKRRMEFSIRISYSDSIDTAFDVLNGIIASEKRFLKEPSTQIVVHSMQDSYVNLAVRAWVLIPNYWDVYWHQMRNIKEKIEEAGLSIPFPQQDIHIIQNTAGA